MIRSLKKDGDVYRTTYELGVLQDTDRALVIPSARRTAEVLALLYRNMPVRGMLPAFEFLLKRTDPAQNNRIAYLVSNPGTGKSFLATLFGKARDPRGPIVTDAGGKNLEYLLYQTVFDTKESQSLTDAIDRRLRAGTLDPLSLGALRGFGRHFVVTGGKPSIDWEALAASDDRVFDREKSVIFTSMIDERLKSGALTAEAHTILTDLGVLNDSAGVDWSSLVDETRPYAGLRERLNAIIAAEQLDYEREGVWFRPVHTFEEIQKTIDFVRSVEHLDGDGMNIGFKIIDGPLVQAQRERRDIVIDEITKAKEGSETPLQIVWQVMNGEVAEHTVDLGGKERFTFHAGEPGVVILTGNKPKDGVATHLISESFDRRVPAFEIPDFTTDDWQDRTAQILTSLPLPLLHRIEVGRWKLVDPSNPSGPQKWVLDDPTAFTELLFELSTLEMSEAERRRVKEWKLAQIGNWENALEASAKLGDFYAKYAQLADPESELLRSNPAFADILLEVDNADNPTSKVTPSTMIRHLEEAAVPGPLKMPAEKSTGFGHVRNWDDNDASVPHDAEPIELNYGTRLVEIILDDVYRNSEQVGKHKLFAQLMIEAEAAGMTGNPPLLAQLLNVDLASQPGSIPQAKCAQGVLAALLRELYADEALSPSDEDIIPLRRVQQMLKDRADAPQDARVSSLTSALYVPNVDLNTIDQTLLNRVPTHTPGSGQIPPTATLVEARVLLAALALPAVGSDNLDALWSSPFTNGAFSTDEPTAMAQNVSATGLAITTLTVRDPVTGDASPVHILKDKRFQQTTIVGDFVISDDMYNRLKRNKIVYISRHHQTAAARVQAVIGLISRRFLVDLKEAFLMRNEARAGKYVSSASLATLLCDAALTQPIKPTFVLTDSSLFLTPPEPPRDPETEQIMTGLFREAAAAQTNKRRSNAQNDRSSARSRRAGANDFTHG
jgi:hypothetical protein